MSDTANNGQPRHDRGAQFEAGAATPTAKGFAGIVIACRTAWSMAAAPSSGMRASDVLITGREVAFSTGAAVAPRRQGTGHRLLAGLWRVLAWWPNESHRRQYSPPYYIERARMSREIDRL
jgi:Na+/H+-translocating membrane pyrophosphatase